MDKIYRLYSPGYYQTVTGQLRAVRPLSVVDRANFFNKVLPDLGKRLMQLDSLRTEQGLESKKFSFYYDNDNILRELTKECLCICGVNIDEITIDQVYEFLIEQNGDSGWLIRIHQPIDLDPELALQEIFDSSEDKIASMIAALSFFTDDIMKSIELVENVPSDLLEKVLNERNKMSEEITKKSSSDAKGRSREMPQAVYEELLQDYMKHCL